LNGFSRHIVPNTKRKHKNETVSADLKTNAKAK